MIIVPTLIIAALKLIPKEVIEDCRAEAIVAERAASSQPSTDNYREEEGESKRG